MLSVAHTPLRALPGAITDIDVAADGAWVAACESAAGAVICTPHAQFANPMEDVGAIVRLLRNHDIVIISPRAREGQENAAIVSPTGALRRRFFVGDGVEDVLVIGEQIVCTYFDEGVLMGGLGADGICVFGETGSLVLGYHSDVAGAIDVVDCYCIGPAGVDEVCFSAYTEFPIVVLNVRTGIQRVYELPEHLAECRALSPAGQGYYLHDPFEAQTELLSWTPGREAVGIGTYVGRLRGLLGGRFIGVTPDGYALVRASSA